MLESGMPMRRLSFVALVLMLVGCGSTPAEQDVEQSSQEPVPEITLNLPEQDSCRCEPREQLDYTFLDKGLEALHEGEYLDSLQYFQRYQRIEKNAQSYYEARIAIAYLSILPGSPIFDGRSVQKSYPTLRRTRDDDWELHGQILLMEDSLEGFLDMQREITRLRQSTYSLRSDLDKKEEAIRLLRELMLGREPGQADSP